MVAVNPLPQSLDTTYSHLAACAALMCMPSRATEEPSNSFFINVHDFADRNFINQSSRKHKSKLQIIDAADYLQMTRVLPKIPNKWKPDLTRKTQEVDKTRSETLLTYFYG